MCKMKKMVGIFIVLLVIIGLVACNKNKEDYLSPEDVDSNIKSFDYVEAENIDKYKLVQTIELPENKADGYTWQYEIIEPTVVVSVNNEYVEKDSKNSGVRIFSFQGIKEGTSEIVFTKRALKDEISLAQNLRYVFNVNSNNEIAITDQLK